VNKNIKSKNMIHEKGGTHFSQGKDLLINTISLSYLPCN
jgi:hypothetical protein